MQIEKIQYQQNKGVFIYTIAKKNYWVSYEKYIEWAFHQNDEVDSEMLALISKENSKNQSFSIAERYALYKPRTVQEVINKLRLNQIEEDHIEGAIEKLKKLGLLDDDSFAKRYVEEMYRSKDWSRYQLYAKLMEKGIGKNIVSSHLDQITDTMEKEKVSSILNKKYFRRDYSSKKEKDKVAQALMRRGFNSNVVKSAMKDFLQEWSDDDY